MALSGYTEIDSTYSKVTSPHFPEHKGFVVSSCPWRIRSPAAAHNPFRQSCESKPHDQQCVRKTWTEYKHRVPLDKSEGFFKGTFLLSGAMSTADLPEKVEDQGPGISRVNRERRLLPFCSARDQCRRERPRSWNTNPRHRNLNYTQTKGAPSFRVLCGKVGNDKPPSAVDRKR